MQSSLHLPHLAHGTALGELVGLVSATVVPDMGLTPRPSEQPVAKNVMMMGLYLVYGAATAAAFHALSSEGQK